MISPRKQQSLDTNSLSASASDSSLVSENQPQQIIPSTTKYLKLFLQELFLDSKSSYKLLIQSIQRSIATNTETSFVRSTVSVCQYYHCLKPVLIETFRIEVEKIPREKNMTSLPTTFLRGDTVFTKLLGEYSRRYGTAYRKYLIVPLITKLNALPQIELDPSQIDVSPSTSTPNSHEPNVFAQNSFESISNIQSSASQSDPIQAVLDKNVETLKTLAQSFFDTIIHSIERMPLLLREILLSATEIVKERFPQMVESHRYAFMGAIIFLRYICPALVVPHVHNVVKTPPPRHVSRGLLLVSKILQNLANSVEFGDKEQFMTVLNPFLIQNRLTLRAYFRHVVHFVTQHSASAASSSSSPLPSTTTQESSQDNQSATADNSEKFACIRKPAIEIKEFLFDNNNISSVVANNPDLLSTVSDWIQKHSNPLSPANVSTSDSAILSLPQHTLDDDQSPSVPLQSSAPELQKKLRESSPVDPLTKSKKRPSSSKILKNKQKSKKQPSSLLTSSGK